MATARMLQGKELSFNNIADTDTAVECVRVFNEPACVIVKHANPCGVATAVSLVDAYDRAYRTDPTSAFGGIIAFNRELDEETAAAIAGRQFVEVIAAPSISAAAAAVLAGKQNIRVLAIGALANRPDFRSRIPQRRRRPAGAEPRHRARRSGNLPDRHAEETHAHAVRGPVVRLARVQVREIECHRVRARRHDDWRGRRADVARVFDAHRRAQGQGRRPARSKAASMASDAFFPFRDGIDVAAEYGITAIVQPGGSKRDEEVIAAADEHGMTMVFTGMRHFRH